VKYKQVENIMGNPLQQINQLSIATFELIAFLQSVKTPRFNAKLNAREKSVVCHIGGKNGCTMKELSERFQLGASTMTGVIDRLEKKGIVERQPCESDRRAVLVSLEDKWQQIYEIYFEQQKKFAAILMEAITKEKFDSLMKLLPETTKSAKERMAKVNGFVSKVGFVS
jgi:DNA-binding MarR family transcriptional regulator